MHHRLLVQSYLIDVRPDLGRHQALFCGFELGCAVVIALGQLIDVSESSTLAKTVVLPNFRRHRSDPRLDDLLLRAQSR